MTLNLFHLPKRKGAGLVRGLLPDIEAALHEGATLKDIYAVLQADHDLTITFNSFKVALHRIRKEEGGRVKPGAVGVSSVGSEPEAFQQLPVEAPKTK